ncbi:hypothetical protein [Collimonas humicola]|uniref:hypothetical protein n=1 Tax=Collimonas humicola TaxID=2825886 RepID=UPI001B8CAA3D|nr:hypothetical protein [Collimonas humicola]
MSELTPAFQGELMLANWKETHSGGATVTFMLADKGDLDLFRHLTVKKANMAGQRFMAVLVEINDDEKPVTQKLSQQAALMCKSLGFQQFVEYKSGYQLEGTAAREKMAADFVRSFCGVESRSELDSAGRAGMLYQQLLADYRSYSINL